MEQDARTARMIAFNRESNPARTRPCSTPDGEFDSLTSAAEARGISRQAVQQRIKRGSDGWAYQT